MRPLKGFKNLTFHSEVELPTLRWMEIFIFLNPSIMYGTTIPTIVLQCKSCAVQLPFEVLYGAGKRQRKVPMKNI